MQKLKNNIWKELVNAKLDGTLTKEQEHQLNRMLAESAEARTYLEKVLRVHELAMHDASEKIQVPTLTDGIMAAIKQKSAATEIKAGVKTFHLKHFNQQFLKYAAVLVIGLLIGSGITWLIREDGGSTNFGHALGTMHARQLKHIQYNAEDVQITIEPVVAGQMLLVLVTVHCDSPANLMFQMNPGSYRVLHTRYISYENKPQSEAFGGRVRFGFNGQAVIQLVAEFSGNPPPSIPVELEMNGEIVYHSELFVR